MHALLHIRESNTANHEFISASNVQSQGSSTDPGSSTSLPADKISLCATPVTGASQCLLATASLLVPARDGQLVPATALLDAGSDVYLISQSRVKKLDLPVCSTSAIIHGISSVKTSSSHCINLSTCSHNTQRRANINTAVVPTKTANLSSFDIPANAFTVPTNLSLVDPKFNISKSIDLLLGASIFCEVLTPGQ